MTEYTWEEQRAVEHADAPGHDPNANQFHTYQDEQGNTVREYAMDAEEITVTPGAHVDWNTMVSQMVEMAERRVGEQIVYVHGALLQFQPVAHQRIAQFVADNTPAPELSFGALVEGLTSGLWLAFGPEGEIGKLIFEKAISFVTANVEQHLRSAEASRLEHARQQLEAGVDTLVQQAATEVNQVVDHVRDDVRHQIGTAMQGEQHPSTDAEWLNEMVTWMGFPQVTGDSASGPLLRELESSLDTLLQQAQAQLHEHG